MKQIELRRHSMKSVAGNASLSEEGKQLANKIGKTYLRGGEFTNFFISPLSRTSETFKEFKAGAKDFVDLAPEIFPPHLEVSEQKDALSLWEGPCYLAEIAGEDMLVASFKHMPEITEDIAIKSEKSFTNWVALLPENSKVLVVGHSPFIELIVYGLFGDKITQLEPCEGVLIKEQGGVYSYFVIEESHVLHK